MLSLSQQNALRERYRALRPGWRPATELFAGRVRARLAEAGRALDLGCGRGGLVEQLREAEARRVVGIDPDWSSLAGHRLAWLPRVAGFSAPLPFADGSFDVVFSSWLLEHLAEPATDLAEIARVLRPAGSFIFVTPNKKHPLALVNRVLGGVGALQGRLVERAYGRAAEDAFQTHYRANTVEVVQQLSRAAGFGPPEFEVVADPTYLVFHPALFRPVVAAEELLPKGWGVHLVGELRVKS